MQMHMPQPSAEHQQLHALAGTWRGSEIMHPGPMGPGGKSVGTTVARMSEDGFYLIADYSQMRDGAPSFWGHSVIGYDVGGRRYLWYWVDSMGMPPATATAGRFEGAQFVFESTTPQCAMRYVYELHASDRYVFKIEVSTDGGKSWMAFMEGDYSRVK